MLSAKWLVLLMGCMQEETAEDVFQKLEKTILESKTLTTQFDWGRDSRHLPDKECGARRSGSWGSIVLKDLGMVVFKEWGCSGPNEILSARISNGGRICQMSTAHQPDGTKRRSRAEDEKERDTPKGLGENLRVAFLRSGSRGAGWILSMVMESPESTTPDARNLFQVANLSKGVDTSGSYLKYRLSTRSPSGPDVHQSIITLWYEPKTYRLLKRSKCNEEDVGKKDAIVWFDEYEQFDLNAQVPDTNFVFPKEQ